MSLTNDFNEFAGKVVNTREIAILLNQQGFSNVDVFAPTPAISKKLHKVEASEDSDELKAATEALSLKPSIYINSRVLAEIERKSLQEETPALAKSSLATGLADPTVDFYIEIQPVLKITAWASDDDASAKKMSDAFIKAAKDCTDYKSAVGSELQDLEKGIEGIAAKIAKKFKP